MVICNSPFLAAASGWNRALAREKNWRFRSRTARKRGVLGAQPRANACTAGGIPLPPHGTTTRTLSRPGIIAARNSSNDLRKPGVRQRWWEGVCEVCRARAGSGAATEHRGGVARFESSPIAPESPRMPSRKRCRRRRWCWSSRCRRQAQASTGPRARHRRARPQELRCAPRGDLPSR